MGYEKESRMASRPWIRGHVYDVCDLVGECGGSMCVGVVGEELSRQREPLSSWWEPLTYRLRVAI